MRTFMYIAIALSCFIPFCVFLMDCLAVNTRKHDVHEEFKNWSITNGTGIPPDELYSSAKVFTIVDGIIFLVSIVALMITGIYYCGSSCWSSAPPTNYCDTMLPWYFLTFPATNFAAHFNQISLGFIHTHQHAVVVLIIITVLLSLLVSFAIWFVTAILICRTCKSNYRCECLCVVPIVTFTLFAVSFFWVLTKRLVMD